MNVEILDASGRPIKSAADASEEAARVFAGLATGTRPPRRGTTELVVAYTEMPGLRQVVQRIAESEASIPFVVYRSKNAAGRSTRDHKLQRAHGVHFHRRAKQMQSAGDLEELENDLIVQFLDRGNPCLSGFECRQVMGTHFELVGECFAWIERNRLGVPQFYWPLPPSWVADVPAPGQGFFEIQIAGARRKVEARDMLYIRDPDPTNPYGRGTGIAASLADELDTDEYAARFLKAFFYNDATPSLAVVWPQSSPTPEQMKEIEQKMMEKHRGAEKGFRVHMFNSNPTITQFTRSLKDMTVVELRKFLYELIRQTWGLPPEVLGVIENSNRATIDAAAFLMGLFILMPRLSRWRIALQTQLVPQFDERKVIGFESPVPEDENRKLEIAKAASWALSRAEWREWMGYETQPTDEVYLQPMTLEERVVGQAAPPPPEPTPEPAPPAAEEPDDDQSEEAEDDEAKARAGRERYRRRWWPPQAGDTIGKAAVLDLGDVDRLTALVDPQLLTRQTEELWSKELRAWGDRMIGELGVSVSFNILNPRVSEHLRAFAGERITRINNSTRDAVRTQLVAAVEAGEAYKDVARRIEDVFDDARGRRAAAIARTEPAISANWATWEAQRQSGVVQKRAWVSTPDDRAREQHLEMDGKVVGIEEPFTFPDGTTTMAPCLSGVAEHDINCRCTTVAVIEDKAVHDSASKDFDDDLIVWEGRAERAFRRAFATQAAAVERELKAIAARRGQL